MTFAKTSLLSGISVVIKLLTLLGVNKVLAIYLGPSGYALIGQFQNMIQLVTVIGSGAFGNGVTKYTAEYSSQPENQYTIWQTAFFVSVGLSILISFFIFLFSHELSLNLFRTLEHELAIVVFSVSIIFFSLNTLLLAIINGKKEVGSYVSANIFGSVISALISVILVINYGVLGGLVALAVYQSVGFFATFLICLRMGWFKVKHLIGLPDRNASKKLMRYSLMAFVSAICVPVTHIFIRDYLSEQLSVEYAGLWEAMTRISTLYLMVITTTLTLYYLPKLSELKDRAETLTEVLSVTKIVVPALIALSGFIYLFKDAGITLLFSESFLGISDIYIWQLCGDILKVSSWLFAFVMISKSMVAEYIFSEVLFSLIYYALVNVMVGDYGFQGVSIAYMATYFLYLFFVVYVVFFRYKEGRIN